MSYTKEPVAGSAASSCWPASEDSLSISDPFTLFPPVEPASINGFVKHVFCDGARFHVLSWDSYGHRCSQRNCIMNHGRPDCDVLPSNPQVDPAGAPPAQVQRVVGCEPSNGDKP